MAGGGVLLLTVKRSRAKIFCVGVRGPGVGLLSRALRILPVWNSIYGLHRPQATCTATYLGQAQPSSSQDGVQITALAHRHPIHSRNPKHTSICALQG